MCESAGQGRCASWLGAGSHELLLGKGNDLGPGRHRRAWLKGLAFNLPGKLPLSAFRENSIRSCFGIALNPICAQIFAVRNEEQFHGTHQLTSTYLKSLGLFLLQQTLKISSHSPQINSSWRKHQRLH
jgi:hypothetical protein